MSWLPRTSRTFRIAAGMAVSASVFAWVLRREAVDVNDIESEDREKNRVDKSESSPLSSLGLGKVLASWTTNFKPSVVWDNDWDRRNPKNMVKPVKKLENSTGTEDDTDYQNRVKQSTPTASRHLLLIRHGQYFMDTDKDEDRHLTKLGREQAQLTGKRLKELNFPYTTVISSTMTRAKETADLLQEFLPSIPRKQCDLLREGAPIPPEPPVGHWRPEANFYKDGARIEAAFRKYFHRADASQEKDSYEVVVCHANVIRFCVCRVLQFPPEAWLRISLQNGSITWVTIRPSGRVSLRTLSDSGHMPPDMLTTT